MLMLTLDLGAMLILPAVCIACVIRIMTAASVPAARPPTSPVHAGSVRAPDPIAAEAARGLLMVERHLREAAAGRRLGER
jgi:hypothetical protein